MEYITVGVGYALQGVRLAMQDPDDPNEVITLTLEPEFARRVAQSLTLRSFECEDARRKHIEDLGDPR